MKLFLLISAAITLTAYASAQQPTGPAPGQPVAIGTWADESQLAVAEAQLDTLMSAERTKQIGKTVVRSGPPRGYSTFNWLETGSSRPLTIAATCDGECEGLKLEIRGAGGYSDILGVNKGAGQAIVVLPAGHPERVNAVVTLEKCDAPACAFAIGVYDTAEQSPKHPPTNLSAKRNPLPASLDDKAIGAGWKRTGGVKVADLKDLKTHEFKMMVYPGMLTMILGQCEQVCGDVSLSAVDDAGAEIKISTSSSAENITAIRITSPSSDITVRAVASACPGDSCQFAIGAYH